MLDSLQQRIKQDSKDKSSFHDMNFISFFFNTFCIKLKSFFSLQHTLSCESDVKEVERE